MEIDETCAAAACRELLEETGIAVFEDELTQGLVFDRVDRHPGIRVLCVPYATFLENTSQVLPVAGDDAEQVGWFRLTELPEPLAFDHAEIIAHLAKLWNRPGRRIRSGRKP